MEIILEKLLTSDSAIGVLIGVLVLLSPKIWAFIKLRFKQNDEKEKTFKDFFVSEKKDAEYKDTVILNLTSENARLKTENDIYTKELELLKSELKYLKREA